MFSGSAGAGESKTLVYLPPKYNVKEIAMMKRLVTAAILFTPFLAMADETKTSTESNPGTALLAILVFVVLIALAFSVWSLYEWIGAKSGEAAERTRKLKLENDKLEIEVEELRNAKPAQGGVSRL